MIRRPKYLKNAKITDKLINDGLDNMYKLT